MRNGTHSRHPCQFGYSAHAYRGYLRCSGRRWFLDLLYNVARTLSLDEAQHILSVHLLPQVQPLFIDGKLGDLQDDDLLNAILLWHSTSVVAHRCAVPFPSQSLHDLIEAFDGDLSPCQSVLALFILCSHVAGIELNDDALFQWCVRVLALHVGATSDRVCSVVKRCIDLLEATGDISSPVTTRALPLPLDCVLRSLKSSSNGLSPHHLVVLLRRLSRGLESKGNVRHFGGIVHLNVSVRTCQGVCAIYVHRSA